MRDILTTQAIISKIEVQSFKTSFQLIIQNGTWINDYEMKITILYGAHKPKRRKRIWGARSRDQSRCKLKIMSFKVSFKISGV